MPRKKQKGPPRSKSAPPKPGPGPGPSQSKSKPKASGSKDGKDAKVQANQRPIIPFLRGDRILLVGEGDFSFARSLAKQYKCRKLLATCYDSKETLFEKYPQAEGNIQAIIPGDESKPYPKVLFSIDARKLGEKGGGGKEVKNGFPRRIAPWKVKAKDKDGDKPSGPWDVICFNFPHVGGISTDVNRQVRFNQELLVGVFKACVPLLSEGVEGVEDDEDEDEWDEDEDEDVTVSGKAVRTGPGQILVSLFEGEPYTLWNIRDLARHAGLQVVTSFRFPWSSYEGYSHARTLGEVEGKNGGRGGWRGEDREARMYVFEVKREEKKKKRTRDELSDSE